MERDVQGSILGHTFHCIVAEQFYRTRVGDRFFYDNGEMQHSFTPGKFLVPEMSLKYLPHAVFNLVIVV